MKLYAGPTPAGTYISRRTDNAYTYAVAIVDESERYYAPRDPAAVNGYIPNPTLGQYVSLSWHSRRDLADKKVEQLRSRGRSTAVVVPVIDGKPEAAATETATCARCGDADATTHQEFRNAGDREYWANRTTDRCDRCAQDLRDYCSLAGIGATIVVDRPLQTPPAALDDAK